MKHNNCKIVPGNIIKTTIVSLITICTMLLSSINVNAQEQNLYYVYVKQGFTHWGSCSSDPDYEYADIRLYKGSSELRNTRINIDRLNKLVGFEFKKNGKTSIGDIITKIKVHTRASDIKNDKHLHYELNSIEFGKDSETADASDPCNNFISHNREGYAMTTTVIVDNPIYMTNTAGTSYKLEYEVPAFKIDDYYENRHSTKPVLEYYSNMTNKWTPLKSVIIKPGKTIFVPYELIAGKKSNPNSNYYKWMGKTFDFRIVKTLLGGQKSFGNIISSIKYYPAGPNYTVLHTERNYCNKIDVYIKFKDSDDNGYLNKDLFFWRMKTGSVSYNCIMHATKNTDPINGANTYRIELQQSGMPKDPFTDSEVDVNCTLQLEVLNMESYAVNKDFTIPPKPKPINVDQKKPPMFTINGVAYDIPSINNPYVMLDITDDDKSYVRKPYKVYEGDKYLATIDELPEGYDDMTPEEKAALDARFETEYEQLMANPNSSYRNYFNIKLKEWAEQHSETGEPLKLNRGINPKLLPDNNSYLFLFDYVSDNSGYNIYKKNIGDPNSKRLTTGSHVSSDTRDIVIHPNGQYYFYARVYRNDLDHEYSIFKAPISGGNGVQITPKCDYITDLKISPDNKTLYFKARIGSYNSAIYKISTNATNITNPTKIIDVGLGWYEFRISHNGKFILYRNSKWHTCKYDIATGTSTEITDVTADAVVLAPNDQFFLYKSYSGNSNSLYKAPIGNSINNGVKLTNDIVGSDHGIYISKDCSWVLFADGYYKSTELGGSYGEKPDHEKYTVRKAPIGNSINNGYKLHPKFRSATIFAISKNEGFAIYYDSYNYHAGNPYPGYLYLFVLDINKTTEALGSVFYPNKGIAEAWYDEYKAIYKEKWLDKTLGIKISNGIKVNQDQTLKLIDNAGCEYPPFPIHVKAPKEGSFTTSVVKNPSDACAKDGEVKVTYNGGGVPPYINASGELRTIGNSIVVKGMGYGENTIFFTDAYGQESSPLKVTIGSSTQGITDVVAHDQTCDPANGSIKITIGSISGTKTYKLIDNDNSKSYTKQTTSNTHTFTGLPNGKYSAYVTSGTCSFAKENIPVDYKVFSIKDIIPTDALVIGGSGDVTINFTNRTGNINWLSGVPSVFNPTDNKNSVHYTSVLPGTYNFDAKHTDIYNQGCDISGSFTIDKPKFELTINTDETEEGLSISVNLTSGNGLIVPYRFTIKRSDGNTEASGQNNSSFGATITRNGSYSLNMSYGSSTVKIYDFSYPSPTITENHILTPIKCPGTEGSITVNPTGGIDGTDLTYSTDGVTFNNTKTYTTKAGYFEYSVRDKNTEYADISGNPVTIKRTLTNSFRINIPEPDNVSATVNPVDVTCNGLNNGKIIVQNATGGSGSYQYRVNTDTWTNTDNVTTGLAPGEHTVYIKDSGNNCPEVTLTTTTISEPPILEIDSVRVVQPKCEQPNGELYIRVKGGNGSYKFNWIHNGNSYSSSDDFTTETESYLGHKLNHGSYSLTIYDNKNCKETYSTNLKQYYNPKINNIDITDARCNNDANGSAKITDVSGTTTISAFNIQAVGTGYTNQINSIDESFTNLKKGVYNITATDDSACVSNIPFPVTINHPEVAIHTVIGDIIPSLYKDVNGGRIHYTIKGGNEGLKTVRLLDAKDNETATISERNDYPLYFNNLYAGNYKIEVTDIKGCSHISDVQTVNEPEKALGFRVVDKKDARCKASTGEFTVEAFGGWGEYKYRLATDNGYYNTNAFKNRYAGSYTVTVRDKMGAEFTDNIMIHEPKEELMAEISDFTAPTCGSNGNISVDIKGGTAPYKLFFESETDTLYFSSAVKRTINNRPAGSYTMQLRDKNGCIFKNQTELSDGDMLKIDNVEFTYPANSISADGAIKANAWGGSSPLTYKWKNINGTTLPYTGDKANNISSGHYTVTAIEQDGCSVSKSVYLPSAADMELDIVTINHEQSYLANDGSAQLKTKLESLTDIEIIDPDGTKMVQAANESTSLLSINGKNLNLNNLKGGEYFIVAKNMHGEREFTPLLIKPYRRFFFKDINAINTRKMNDPSGSITVAVEGGAGENSYKWEFPASRATTPTVQNSDNTSSVNKAVAGDYKLTVTDKFNNTITKTVTIKQPDAPLDITIADFANQSCKGYKDAWVTLKAEGGWGEYQYRQDIKEHYINDQVWRNLDVRKHYFYITDKMGVTDSVAIDIKEPEYVKTKLKLIDSVDCKNGADGKVMFNVTGGTKPYRFRLKNEPDIWINDTTARDLKSGNYTYIFTDKNNCTGQDTMKIYVPEPDSLLFRGIDVTHTTCNSNNGIISVSMKGGTRPYKYQWTDLYGNNLGTTNAVNNLEQNSRYNVSITDAHNCVQHHQQLIKPSTKPVIDAITTTPVLCHGEATGTAKITKATAAIPFAPYSFKWSNNNTGESSVGYKAGSYSVTITDENNCTTTKKFDITEPDTLKLSVTDFKNAHCFGYNDGHIEVNASGGIADYKYSWTNGATTNRIESLTKGTYGVKITDKNDCIFEKSFEITEPEKLTVDLGEDIKMCPGNSIDIDGQDFTTHKWYNKNGVITNERFVKINKQDEYYLEVTNNIGCFARDTINVFIGNDALKADFLMPSEAALNDTIFIYEISNISLDSMKWEYKKDIFTDITEVSLPEYILHLKSKQMGIYNVALKAYSGGCVSTSVKQVEIVDEDGNNNEDKNIGYSDPLILEITIFPNPTDGNFIAKVKLREVADIELSLFSINYGSVIDKRERTGLKTYEVDYQLGELNTGVYVLMVVSGNERKQVKIVVK
jgi:hypothetical protein